MGDIPPNLPRIRTPSGPKIPTLKQQKQLTQSQVSRLNVLETGSLKLRLTKSVGTLSDGKSQVFEAESLSVKGERLVVFKMSRGSTRLLSEMEYLLGLSFIKETIHTMDWVHLVRALRLGQTTDDLLTSLSVKRMTGGLRVSSKDTSLRVKVGSKVFQVTELLGKGADGAAYNAKDLTSGGEVVLKVFGHKTKMYSQEKWVMTLIKERTGDKRLLAFDDANLVLVQRKIEGYSLALVLQQYRYYPFDLGYLKAQYDTLARSFYAQTGLLHGDIRPENIIYNPRTRQMSLIDFARSRFPKGKKGSKSVERELVGEELYADGEFGFSLMNFDAHVALSQAGKSEQIKGLVTAYLVSLKNRGDHEKAKDFAQEAVQAGNDWAVELFRSLYPDFPRY